MAEQVDGLLHGATRPAGKPPLPAATIERVDEMTLAEPSGEATHWTGRAMAKAAEGFFAKLTWQRLKRGVFTGIVDLQAAINHYLAETNKNPKPFIWTADPDAIIEKVLRGRQALSAFGVAR